MNDTVFLLLILAAGTIAIFAIMFFTSKYNHMPVWKAAVSSVMLTLLGVLGTKLMVFIESGYNGGRGFSFYGAVFFTPILMLGVALLLRIPCGRLLDVCAPSECVMLALMKLNCIRSGCCRGIIIGYNETPEITTPVRFPSQIVELITALVILAVLIFVIAKGKMTNCVYPLYMIIYGATRFVLNFFRETEPFALGLSSGHFWSIISIVAGIALIIVIKYFAARKAKRKIA